MRSGWRSGGARSLLSMFDLGVSFSIYRGFHYYFNCRQLFRNFRKLITISFSMKRSRFCPSISRITIKKKNWEKIFFWVFFNFFFLQQNWSKKKCLFQICCIFFFRRFLEKNLFWKIFLFLILSEKHEIWSKRNVCLIFWSKTPFKSQKLEMKFMLDE